MTTNTQNQYMNLTTTGFGFINRARIIPTHTGQYMAVDVALKHGRMDAPKSTRFDAKLTDTVAEILEPYMDQINAKNTPVQASVVLGDLDPELFTYKNGDKKGEPGISLKSRLIRVKYLKVGEEIVFQEPKNTENVDQGNDQADNQPVAASEEANTDSENWNEFDPKSESNQEPEALPKVVKLDKSDPEFGSKKDELKSKGYRWNNQEKSWVLPEAA